VCLALANRVVVLALGVVFFAEADRLSLHESRDVAASIRDKIRSGLLPLPSEPPQKCYGGKGTGQLCDGCDEVITPEQIEYELGISESRTLSFHDECLVAWHATRAERLQSPPASTAVHRRGSVGGYARAARLTAEQRSAIARQAVQARWQRFRNGIGTGPPDARLGGLARAQQLTPEQRGR
jgi:hypothetical protein